MSPEYLGLILLVALITVIFIGFRLPSRLTSSRVFGNSVFGKVVFFLMFCQTAIMKEETCAVPLFILHGHFWSRRTDGAPLPVVPVHPGARQGFPVLGEPRKVPNQREDTSLSLDVVQSKLDLSNPPSPSYIPLPRVVDRVLLVQVMVILMEKIIRVSQRRKHMVAPTCRFRRRCGSRRSNINSVAPPVGSDGGAGPDGGVVD